MGKGNKTLIIEISDLDFDPKHKMSSADGYSIRRSSRGIIINNGKIAIANITKYHYYKLPGGGLNEDESINEGFKREVMEEVGCNCEILDQSGIIIEWRDQFKLLQISYVFLAKVVGEVGQNKLEPGEIDEGFTVEWVSVEEIEKILNSSNSTNYEGKFIEIRDRSIYGFYKDRLAKINS